MQNPLLWVRTVYPVEKRNVFLVYFIVLMGTALDNLNSTSALPMEINIQHVFNTNSATSTWVLSSYALTLGSFILIAGKIGDIIGPHNLYLGGLTIMWVCSLICACLPDTSIITLIVFRAFQGVGASALVPSAISLAANYFNGDKSKYLQPAIGALIIALVGTMGVGLIIGGAFAESSIGFKGFYYLSFAWGLLCDVILFFLIIPINKTDGHNKLKMKNLDFTGAFLVVVGFLLIILGLTNGGENWRLPKAYVPLVVGAFTVLSAFVFEVGYIKRYQVINADKDPTSNWKLELDLLFPTEILKIPNFIPFFCVSSTYYATYIMQISCALTYYIYIEGRSPIIASVKALPISIGLIFGALTYRESYYNKIGTKNVFILSAVFTLIGAIWFSRTDFRSENSYWKCGMVPLFIFGYGNNIFFNIYMVCVVENTPLHLQGVVNGVFQAFSQVLMSIGNALVPSILGTVLIAKTTAMQLDLHKKLQNVMYVIIGFHVFVLILMVFVVKDPKKLNKPNEVLIQLSDSFESTEKGEI